MRTDSLSSNKHDKKKRLLKNDFAYTGYPIRIIKFSKSLINTPLKSAQTLQLYDTI